jgi:hypothetical protein
MIGHALQILAPTFRAQGLPLIPIKGIVLARWLYSDVADRPLRDLDLLIRRRDRLTLRDAANENGWPIVRDSDELGELEFQIQGVSVEAHAEVVRKGLTTFSAEDFLARSTLESDTFGFEIRRLDDVDHTLLLLIELVKDWFVEANAHQPEDLNRLMLRIPDRIPDLIGRATQAGFVTGLYNAARWLAEEQHSDPFQRLLIELGPPRRRVHPYLVRQIWKAKRPVRTAGLALSCWTNDSWEIRARCLATIARRGFWRALGRDPG